MIIFYNKKTGKIVGNIEGRIHTNEHLNMWIGDREETDRIVCNWVKKSSDKDSVVLEPELQKEIFSELDKDPKELKKYKVVKGKLVTRDK
jgi:hypothetical protein